MLPNAANDSGNPEKIKAHNSTPNVHGLLKEAIQQEFGDPVNPEKFDMYRKDKTKINERIFQGMHDLRRQNMEDWGDVTDDLIQQYTTETLLNEKVANIGKNLVIRRKRAFDRVGEVFPQISDERADWEAMVRVGLSEMNERELEAFIQKTHLVRKFIHRTFPNLQNTTPSEKRNFERIFHDWKDRFQNPDDRTRVKKIFHNYSAYGQVPDADDMNFLLSAYHTESMSRKKDILSAMGVVLSFRDAYDLGLIDDDFLVQFSEEQFGSSYEQMGEFEKKSLIRSLSKNESHAISAKDFSEQGMDRVFSGEGVKRKFLQELTRSIALDTPEVPKNDDIVSQIRERKQREALARDKNSPEYGMEDDYDLHDEFVNEMMQRLQKSDGTNQVKNLKRLKEVRSVIRFDGADGNPQYIRLEKVQDVSGGPLEVDTSYGVQLEGLSVTNGYIRDHQHFPVTYQKFYEFLKDNQNVNVLSSDEFENLLTLDEANAGKDGKIFDARNVDQDPVTAENILTKMNLLDPSGTKYGFETGTYFSAPSEETKTGIKSSSDIWKVHKIHGDTLDIQSSTGNIETNIPLQDFFNVIASSGTFRRTNKITDDASMIEALTEFRVAPGATIKDGKLTMTEKDHDGHDPDTHISCFVGENKEEHIHIEFFRDGLVRFGEYKSPDELQKVKEYAKKKGIKDGGIYSWKTMSYGAFVDYLKNQKKLNATTEHVIVPDAHHDLHGDHDHAHHPHIHGSFWSRIMKMQNPASIWKGFEMIIHGIEHTLEKGAKLDAARFAMGTANFLHLPDTVSAQIYSDIVNNSKEIIEKYRDKIFGLPGPRGREKVLHIIENTDSRPEEVGAAISYMLKSYGHLYAEDIRHKQTIVTSKEQFTHAPAGTFLFFDAIVTSTNVGGSLSAWRKKAYEKAIGELGSETSHTDGEPNEEILIHSFFKMVDGNWDKYPYAASVVKAMGGPSGYEKMWKFEGFEDAYKKGKEQTGMVSPQGRLNKAISYLNTHELNKFIGSMEATAGKVKAPEFQAAPFIWAVGGFSRYASPTMSQKLKSYSEMGFTFHSYSFLRNPTHNDVYLKTVRLALDHIGGGYRKEFDGIQSRLQYDSSNPEKTKGAAVDMMNFWQKQVRNNTGLHEMLQGQNGWLLKKRKEGNAIANDYWNIILGQHSQALKDGEIPTSEVGSDWFNEHGFQNLIFSEGSDGLRSLGSMLNKIKFIGTSPFGGREMNDIHKEKNWNYICKYMTGSLRDIHSFSGDTHLQKEQYLSHRREILHYFAKQMNTRVPITSDTDKQRIIKNIETFEYYSDLRRMGISPEAVFSLEDEKSTEEADYTNWISHSSAHTTGTQHVQDMQDYFRGKVSRTNNQAANDDGLVWKDSDAIGAGGGVTATELDPYDLGDMKEAA